MELRVIGLKIKQSDIDFLKILKSYNKNYDKVINQMADECGNKILNVSDFSYERLRRFPIRMYEDTIVKLDLLSQKYEMSRSETLRRLIKAKANKLC